MVRIHLQSNYLSFSLCTVCDRLTKALWIFLINSVDLLSQNQEVTTAENSQAPTHQGRASKFISELAGHIHPSVLAQPNQISHSQSCWVTEDLWQPHSVPLADREWTHLAVDQKVRQDRVVPPDLCHQLCKSAHFWSCLKTQIFLYTMGEKGQKFHLMLCLGIILC